MRNKTFPKEGSQKLKDTIQKLKGRNRYLEKKIKFYENEAVNETTLRPKTLIKTDIDVLDNLTPSTKEEARKDILRRFRESLKKEK